MAKRLRIKTLLTSLLTVLLICAATAAPPVRAASRSATFSTVAQAGTAATVGVYYEKDKFSQYYGTGVVISPDGYILTSTTVVLPGAEGNIDVYFADNTRREAMFVESAEEAEATLLKVEATDLPHVPIATDLPQIGERAYTYANARHSMRSTGRASFSAGRVTGIYRVGSDPGLSSYEGIAIETDAAINPGQDGGPLLNARGQLAGIVSLSFSDARWLGVAVPISGIREGLAALHDGTVPTTSAPLVEPFPPDHRAGQEFRERAREFAPTLVRLRIQRKYAPRKMPRYFWPQFLRKHREKWEKADDARKARMINSFSHAEKVLGANQQIRRPDDPATGVVISPDGFILTSEFNVTTDTAYIHKERGLHPIMFDWDLGKLMGNPRNYEQKKNPVQNITAVLPDGRHLDARILAHHMPLRIALLKIDAEKLPYLDLSQSSGRARIGHEAAALGTAGEAERVTLNLGIITASARRRGHFFQFGGRINYANSGGPVIDRAGNLLGIATEPLRPGPILGVVLPLHHIVRRWYVAPNSGISFAARIDRIRRDLPRLKAGKSVETLRGAFIGIAMDPAKALSEGAFVGKVVPNSPAEQAGLMPGDQILMMDEEKIDSWKELTATVQEYDVGDRIILTVRRLKEAYRAEIEGEDAERDDDGEDAEPQPEQTEPEEEQPAPLDEEADVGEYKILDIPLTLGERQ